MDFIMPDRKSQTLAVRKVTQISGGKSSCGTVVGIVCNDGRVQVTIREAAVACQQQLISSLSVSISIELAAVEKLPPSPVAVRCKPGRRSAGVVASTTPPSFRPYSAGKPAVMTLIDSISSDGRGGAKEGDRFSVSGRPLTTN